MRNSSIIAKIVKPAAAVCKWKIHKCSWVPYGLCSTEECVVHIYCSKINTGKIMHSRTYAEIDIALTSIKIGGNVSYVDAYIMLDLVVNILHPCLCQPSSFSTYQHCYHRGSLPSKHLVSVWYQASAGQYCPCIILSLNICRVWFSHPCSTLINSWAQYISILNRIYEQISSTLDVFGWKGHVLEASNVSLSWILHTHTLIKPRVTSSISFK